MNDKPARNITQLLQSDQESLEKVLPHVYEELKRLARAQMKGERRGHTLQPTALLHEAFERLIDIREVSWQSRSHFFAMAAKVMRRVLIDHARTRDAKKRGGDSAKVTFNEQVHSQPMDSDELIALDKALERLAEREPRMAQVVELRFFGGLEVEEVAEVLQCSTGTVKRDWAKARLWLYGELKRA